MTIIFSILSTKVQATEDTLEGDGLCKGYKGNNLASNKCGKLGQIVQDQNGVLMEWFMTPTKLSHPNNSIIQIPFTRQFFSGGSN